MPGTQYALCLDGAPATGMAVCVAHALEEDADFAAFKMPHPLSKDARVIFTASDAEHAAALVRSAVASVRVDIDAVLAALPPAQSATRTHPLVKAALGPRQIDAEC